jgi:hypothetical protein
MKNILILVRDTAQAKRFTEAIRVAGGLSQHPELRVSLKLPLPVAASIPQEYFELFAEKGIRLYASPAWLAHLPASLQKIHCDPALRLATVDFDLFVPF